MIGKAKGAFVLACLGAIAVMLLTVTTLTGKKQSRGLMTNLRLPVYSRPSLSVSGSEKAGRRRAGKQADTPSKLFERRNGTHQAFLDGNVSSLYERLVVVTAYSSNHFEEGKGIIGSVQKYMPQTKILLYDIGMTAEERSNASKYCNVEVRTFEFDKYPTHVQTLKKYAWKPIMIEEVSREYDVIMYGDASLRVISHHVREALAFLLEFPFLDARVLKMPIISLTHNATIEYLNFPPSRKHMAEWGTVQATGWLILANDFMKKKVIQPWADCALHPECMAPVGVKPSTCQLNVFAYNDGRYIGCHRFDQSALNIILAKEFGLNFYQKLKTSSIPHQVWKVQRKPTDAFYVSTCI